MHSSNPNDPARRGALWSATVGAAGVAPGTAIGTAAGFVLYNQAGNPYDLVIETVDVSHVSGTLGAGSIFHCVDYNTGHAAPTGTAITPVNANGNFSASTLPGVTALSAATVAAAPTPYSILTSIVGGSGAVQQFVKDTEDLDTELIIAPGQSYQLQAVAVAGTTPLVSYSVTFEVRQRIGQ